jgi:hypothetical protein
VEWWIAGGVVLLSLVFLAVVLGAALGRLRAFAITAMTLKAQLTDGQQRFQPRVLALQAEAESLQGKVVAAQEHAMILQARRERSQSPVLAEASTRFETQGGEPDNS